MVAEFVRHAALRSKPARARQGQPPDIEDMNGDIVADELHVVELED
jgi:hypothetical protein